MRLIGAMSIVFTLLLALVLSGAAPLAHIDDGRHDSSSDDDRGVTQGRGDFPLRYVRRRATVDGCAADARGGRNRPAGNGTRRRTQGRRRCASANCHSSVAQGRCRPGRSRGHDRAAAAQRGRRASRPRQHVGPAHQPRHHLRALPFDGRRFVRAGIGRRRDGWANPDLNVGAIVALSPALDDATTRGVPHVGTGQVRSAASRVRRHEHHPAEQSVAAGRHSADLRTGRRGLRDLHRRRPDLVLEQLRRGGADGWTGNLLRPASAAAHRPDGRTW